MKKYLLTLSALGLLVFASCDKDPSGTGNGNGNGTIDITGKSKRAIFKIQPWKFNNWGDSAENDDVWDDNADAHQLDDIYTFVSDTKVSINDGKVLNSAANGVNPYQESWNMASDNATNCNVIGLDWEIKSQTADKMVLWRKTNDGQMNHYQRLVFTK